MGGLKCEEHVLEKRAPKPAERDAYRVKELILTSTHDKLKDHVLQKLKSASKASKEYASVEEQTQMRKPRNAPIKLSQ